MYYEFNIPPNKCRLLAKEMEKDRDIIRYNFEVVPYPGWPFDFEKCTFAEEMKPVPER